MRKEIEEANRIWRNIAGYCILGGLGVAGLSWLQRRFGQRAVYITTGVPFAAAIVYAFYGWIRGRIKFYRNPLLRRAEAARRARKRERTRRQLRPLRTRLMIVGGPLLGLTLSILLSPPPLEAAELELLKLAVVAGVLAWLGLAIYTRSSPFR